MLGELGLAGQLPDPGALVWQPGEDVHVGDPEVVEPRLLDGPLEPDARGQGRAAAGAG
jgi:hypothetical protein